MSYKRNLSPQKMFSKIAKSRKPLFAFADKSDFAQWQKETLPRVMATLGDFPEQVPPNPELIIEWREKGLIKQRYLIDVAPYISTTLIVARPEKPPMAGKFAAIQCCHGHGPYGKEPVMGNAAYPEIRAEIEAMNYNYGEVMAQNGFLTYAIDWIGFGERNDANKPHFLNNNYNQDWCSVYYLASTMLGMTSLSINIAHGMAATNFVASLPEVDAAKIGVMGLSGGGTMALWLALCDNKVKASEVICYSNLWADFGINDFNYCGMQVAPGLYKLVDLPDLQGLLAPKPLLLDIGIYDTCFLIESSMECAKKVKTIYQAAGAEENLEFDIFPGNHSWGGHKSLEFFKKHLR